MCLYQTRTPLRKVKIHGPAPKKATVVEVEVVVVVVVRRKRHSRQTSHLLHNPHPTRLLPTASITTTFIFTTDPPSARLAAPLHEEAVLDAINTPRIEIFATMPTGMGMHHVSILAHVTAVITRTVTAIPPIPTDTTPIPMEILSPQPRMASPVDLGTCTLNEQP